MSLERPSSRNNFEQRKELNDTERENLIRGSSSFSELDTALLKIGWVKGSVDNFSANVLIDKIQRVRNGELDLEYITRTHGLRDTVARLLEQENETHPQPPKPPREAAVALEIPIPEEESEEIQEIPEDEPSDTPPSGAAGAEEEMSVPELEEDSPLKSETVEIEPPPEPTLEEYRFLDKWDGDSETGTRGGYLIMGKEGPELRYEFASERTKKLWEQERPRYLALREKLEKWQVFSASRQAPVNYAEARTGEDIRKKDDENVRRVRRRLGLRSMQLPGSGS